MHGRAGHRRLERTRPLHHHRYVPTWSGWLYLAVVLDCFLRRVVDWAMADHVRTELVVDALDMAIWRQLPAAGLVHHSDQGCQYTSLAFGRRCREAGITPSMGSVGDAYDNAMAESFFATLECELLTATSSAPTPRLAWPSSTSSKTSTTPAGGTPPSASSAPRTTRGSTEPGNSTRPRDPTAA
jgi:transposase InsO family protein